MSLLECDLQQLLALAIVLFLLISIDQNADYAFIEDHTNVDILGGAQGVATLADHTLASVS
jgi:hypothetical protein